MILTEKEILDAVEAIPLCRKGDASCDICVNAITISNCEDFTSILIGATLQPSLIPYIMAKMIAVGMALAEQRSLEKLVGERISS